MSYVYPDSVVIEAYLSSVWTEINEYVIGDLINEGTGMASDDPTDRTAGVGILSMTLVWNIFSVVPPVFSPHAWG